MVKRQRKSAHARDRPRPARTTPSLGHASRLFEGSRHIARSVGGSPLIFVASAVRSSTAVRLFVPTAAESVITVPMRATGLYRCLNPFPRRRSVSRVSGANRLMPGDL
jgi:hypothetical protein